MLRLVDRGAHWIDPPVLDVDERTSLYMLLRISRGSCRRGEVNAFFTILRYHVSHAYKYQMQGWSYIALVPASLGIENAIRFLGYFTLFGWSSDGVRLVMIAVVSRLGGYMFGSVDD